MINMNNGSIIFNPIKNLMYVHKNLPTKCFGGKGLNKKVGLYLLMACQLDSAKDPDLKENQLRIPMTTLKEKYGYKNKSYYKFFKALDVMVEKDLIEYIMENEHQALLTFKQYTVCTDEKALEELEKKSEAR